jgi:hypothetical protein
MRRGATRIRRGPRGEEGRIPDYGGKHGGGRGYDPLAHARFPGTTKG